jgi:hypothetical protein
MLIPTSNESQLRTMCDNKKGESIPSVNPDRCKRRFAPPATAGYFNRWGFPYLCMAFCMV